MFNPLLSLAGPKVKKTSGRLRAMELKGTMNGTRRSVFLENAKPMQ